jgi:hypothetical protein
VRWIECHPGLAAWVQAVGTILAVVIALTVPIAAELLSRRGRSRRTEEKTLAAFLRLRQEFIRLQSEADLRLQWLNRMPRVLDSASASIWLDGMQLPINPDLPRVADSGGLRADFSKALLLCLETAFQFNDRVRKATAYPEQFCPDRWQAVHPLLSALAASTRDQAANAIEIGLRIST